MPGSLLKISGGYIFDPINGIDGQGPDRRQIPLGTDTLPPGTTVMADEQAGIATRENGPGLFGMGNQGLYAAVQWKRGSMASP